MLRRVPRTTPGYFLNWVTAGDVVAKAPWEELKAEIGGWDFQFCFRNFCGMTAQITNPNSSDRAISLGYSDLKRLAASKIVVGSDVARTLLYRWSVSGRSQVIATEKSLLLAQAMTLAFANDRGHEPTEAEITWMLLRINDHATSLRNGKKTAEARMAELSHGLWFDRHPDIARNIARAELILETAPSNRKELKKEEWECFLERAFGLKFQDYFDKILFPLVVDSSRWMNQKPESPCIDPENWLLAGDAFEPMRRHLLDSITIDLPEARQQCKEALAGAEKQLAAFFFRTPFVRLSQQIWATSPALVRDQLQGGIWGKCFAQMRSENGPQSAKWHQIFGTLFDQYAELVAKKALESASDKAKDVELVGRSGIGHVDEIEDVVLKQNHNVLLASCKASLVPESAVRARAAPSQFTNWLTRLFFNEERSGGFRKGAAFLLDSKIEDIRAGRHSATIAPDSELFPIFVMYENLGDNPLLHSWLRTELAKKSLFTSAGTNPPLILDISTYETLVCVLAYGGNIWTALREAAAAPTALVSTKLDEMAKAIGVRRIPFLEQKYKAATERLLRSIPRVDGPGTGDR